MKRLTPRDVADREVEAAYAELLEARVPGRPYVAVNMVASADGAISVAGRTKALSSEADRSVFHYLRSLADVVLVGAQTVRAERYGPPRIPPERQAERAARGQAPAPRIAIVSGSLDLDWSSALFTDSPVRPIILTTTTADASRAEDVADVVRAGTERVDLPAALAALGAHDVGLVLCEGGPTLNGVLAAADLIDELCLTLAPALVGGDIAAGLLGHVVLPDLLPMELVHAFTGDGDLFLRYRRSPGRRPVEPRGRVAGTVAPAPDTVEVFNELMGDLDFAMAIVTAWDGTEPSGCLMGFSGQLSIHPPRFLACVSKKNHTYGVAARAGVLTVHYPSSDQVALAELFGGETGDETDKFAEVAWHQTPDGGVVLDDVGRWFTGRVSEIVDLGDHVGFVLEPLSGEAAPWPGQLGFQQLRDVEPGHAP